MILTDVRDYLQQHGQAPLRDMALTFNMDQQALKPIIEHWIARGKVEKMPLGTGWPMKSKVIIPLPANYGHG